MKTQNKSKVHPTVPAGSKRSAGLLFFRKRQNTVEVFLVHPGGPFWAKKDDGAWSVPKGEFEEGEDPFEAAKREFQEETSFAPTGEFEPLEPVPQPSGKMVYVWIARGDYDAAAVRSNTFSMELPRGSGKMRQFPEVDRAGWFSIGEARRKLLKGQVAFLDQLETKLGAEN